MADEATFRAQYLNQVATDLKRITLDQDRLRAQIEDLQQQVAALEHDRSALIEMQQMLSRQQTAPATQVAGAEAAGGLGSAPSGRQTLRDLVEEHLGSLRDPASASEVAAALARQHPDRSVQIPVVRNTLEGLVAKGLAVRSKSRRLVFYRAAPAQDGADRA